VRSAEVAAFLSDPSDAFAESGGEVSRVASGREGEPQSQSTLVPLGLRAISSTYWP